MKNYLSHPIAMDIMKTKQFLFVGIGVFFAFMIGLTTWSPWLSDAEAERIVRQRKNFIENNDDLGYPIEEVKVHVMHAPLGRWVTTIEGGWYVGFWNGFVWTTTGKNINR
jgi:hypothetical protein